MGILFFVFARLVGGGERLKKFESSEVLRDKKITSVERICEVPFEADKIQRYDDIPTVEVGTEVIFLHELIALLENYSSLDDVEFCLLPPEERGNFTDEESRNEDEFDLNHLPVKILRQGAELVASNEAGNGDPNSFNNLIFEDENIVIPADYASDDVDINVMMDQDISMAENDITSTPAIIREDRMTTPANRDDQSSEYSSGAKR
ncbi:hypothetical protein GE061_020080 [Apolygus lucorum]|uniref:Uncharacterized protein n=1 Tax=Apolygus lucorum TaxID=248454 RepID=A0A8S9XE86_APOLU|nr:hypothetical protein GE061_020080 [Apolygus lucorum]